MNTKVGRPQKFSKIERTKIRALISKMLLNAEKVTWGGICEKVNSEICPEAKTTMKTLQSFSDIREAYSKAKEVSRGNLTHSKLYAKYSREKLLELVKQLELKLDAKNAELLLEKERKIIEFETYLSRPVSATNLKRERSAKFFGDLNQHIKDGKD